MHDEQPREMEGAGWASKSGWRHTVEPCVLMSSAHAETLEGKVGTEKGSTTGIHMLDVCHACFWLLVLCD